MGNRLVYSPVSMLLMLIFAFLLFAVVGFLFLDLARTAFTKIGFSWGQALFVLLPVVDVVSCNTLLAVNVGGAVIPTLKGFGNCHSRSSSATRCGNSRAPFGLRWGSPA